jgi:hypothetical protein
MGTNEYEPWNLGVNLGSVYAMTGIQKTFTYTYTKGGTYNITAVATNVGRKNVENIDYANFRGNSLDDYDTKRSTAELSITIGK